MKKARVLVVDSSTTIQKVFELALENEDIEVTLSGDGEDALNIIREIRPHIVIADVNTPTINGFELCSRIKEENGLNATPVYLLASALDEFDSALSHKVGADGKFEKPFRSEEMVSQIKKAIAEAEDSADSTGIPPAIMEPVISDDDSFDDMDISIDSIMEEFGSADDESAEDEETLFIEEIGEEKDDETVTASEQNFLEADEVEEPEDSVAVSEDSVKDIVLTLGADNIVDEDEDEDDELSFEIVGEDISEEESPKDKSEDSSLVEEEALKSTDDEEPPITETKKANEPFVVEAEAMIAEELDTDEHDFEFNIDEEYDTDFDDLASELVEESVSPDEDTKPESISISSAEDELAKEVSSAIEGLEQEGMQELLESHVKDEITSRLTDEKIESVMAQAISAAITEMRPQILETLKTVATDITLNVAEELVKQAIEQIKTDTAD